MLCCFMDLPRVHWRGRNQIVMTRRCPNSMEPTEASRPGQLRPVRQYRLASAAHADRYETIAHICVWSGSQLRRWPEGLCPDASGTRYSGLCWADRHGGQSAASTRLSTSRTLPGPVIRAHGAVWNSFSCRPLRICGPTSPPRRRGSGSIVRFRWQPRRTWCSSRRGRFEWAARPTKWTATRTKVRKRR